MQDFIKKLNKDKIFTVITLANGRYYPIMHVYKMKSGLKMTDSMGRSYGWFESMKNVFNYIDQK